MCRVLLLSQLCQVLEGPVYSITGKICRLAHKETGGFTSTTRQSKKVWQRFANDLYSIERIKVEKFSQHINVFHRNIKFTTEEESNGKSAFPSTLLKRKYKNISVLISRKPTDKDQYSHFNSNHQIYYK